MGPRTNNLLAQLNTLQGPAFDTAFAQGQLTGADRLRGAVRRLFAERQERPAQALCPARLAKAKERLDLARRLAGGR